MADNIVDDDLDSLLDSTLNKINERNSAEYDGVLGVLPGWVPDWRQAEFYTTRGRLLELYGHSQILQWIDNHDSNCMAARDCEYIRLEFIPLEIKTDISLLALIKNAVLLGENDGLPQLIGETDAKNIGIAKKVTNGHKGREAHTHKKEFQGLAKKYKGSFSSIRELKNM